MAALIEVRVPDIGDFTDVPIIEVLVTAGDTVAAEDPLIVLESEKATMEVPAPAAGVVGEVAVSVGDTVSQGDLILTLDGGGVGDGRVAAAPPAAVPGEDTPEPDVGADVDPSRAGREADEERPPAAPVPSGPLPTRDTSDGVYAGPGARRLARELGVDLASVAGSGRKGRVTRDDIVAHAEAAPPAAPIPPAAPPPAAAPTMVPVAPAGLPPWPQVDFAQFGPVETVQLTRIQRIAGPALARNWVMIPHVTQHDEADITELEAFRKEVNAAHAADGVKLTMVSLLLKACAAALRAFPTFNASLDGDHLVVKRYYHLGFAADTPQGLMVPVIRDVDRKGLLEIAGELATLSAAAREGTLGFDAMQGGTFTISSLGGIGGTAFTPIINAPEVAILGVSRSVMKPVWNGTEFTPRLTLPLSLSYDHRVIDGAAAARFTTHLAGLLRDPRQMLL